MASIGHALRGFIDLLRSQHNSRIHLLATVLVGVLAFWLKLDRVDWIALLVAIALVWVTEALNTALEYLADAAVPDHHPLIGKAWQVTPGRFLSGIVSRGIRRRALKLRLEQGNSRP